MENVIYEPAREVPIMASYEVIVAGGGIAGIAAALSAKRAGVKRVLLIEKQFLLGGLATLGLVTIYLPLCDGQGRQVSFGLAEELLKKSVSLGAEVPIPDCWLNEAATVEERKEKRYRCQFNAPLFGIISEQQLLQEGIDILYGTSVCQVQKKGNEITGVICENKSGRQAYLAKSVVDTTGDGDVCRLAGENTKLFEPGNLLAGWYYHMKEGKNQLHMLGTAAVADGEKTLQGKKGPSKSKRYQGLDGWELSQMTIDSHKLTLESYQKEGLYTNEGALTGIASIPQVRMTRRLDGVCAMKASDAFHTIEDSVGMISNWKKKGPVYEVPLKALYGKEVSNLYAAGRNMSSEEDMWDVSRVIPACAVTGEAAGIAAAVGRDYEKVAAQLKKRNIPLHIDELNL